MIVHRVKVHMWKEWLNQDELQNIHIGMDTIYNPQTNNSIET